MDEATLQRLQNILGEEDVWAEPQPAVNSATEDRTYDPTLDSDYDLPKNESDSDEWPVRGSNEVIRKNPDHSRSHSHAVAPSSGLEELQNIKFEKLDLEYGDKAPSGMLFCSWNLVKKYPYQFVGTGNRGRVSPFFKGERLLHDKEWDFFYIWNPEAIGQGLMLFVPTEQFRYFLDIINATLHTRLTIPHGGNEEKFNLTFGEFGTPRPRFLGRSHNYDQFEDLRAITPILNPEDQLSERKGQGAVLFMEKLQDIQRAHTGSKKKKSEKHRQERIRRHIAWGRTTKRVQRYLGLREQVMVNQLPPPPKEVNLSAQMPYLPEDDIVFVSVDVELFEFNHSIITEVGFGILDMQNTIGVAPGKKFEKWFPLIQGRHLRIKENAYAVNRVHVQGCETSFNFGDSELVPMKDVLGVITNILEPKSPKNTPLGSENDNTGAHHEPRTVVLVGHDIDHDISSLQLLGYNAHENTQLREIVDTCRIHQHLARKINPTALGTILMELAIRYKFLHNAGNDAVYTLQAMIGLAVKKRQQSVASALGSYQKDEGAPIEDEDGGWSTGGEESDGGVARAPWGPQTPFRGPPPMAFGVPGVATNVRW